MYRIVKSLTRFKLVAKKHVYDGFIKVIIKEGVRAKEGLVCLSSKLKPNNLVSITVYKRTVGKSEATIDCTP